MKAKWSKTGNGLTCFATVLCVLGVTAVVWFQSRVACLAWKKHDDERGWTFFGREPAVFEFSPSTLQTTPLACFSLLVLTTPSTAIDWLLAFHDSFLPYAPHHTATTTPPQALLPAVACALWVVSVVPYGPIDHDDAPDSTSLWHDPSFSHSHQTQAHARSRAQGHMPTFTPTNTGRLPCPLPSHRACVCASLLLPRLGSPKHCHATQQASLV